jgi:single-strand DNA-binding protein
MIKITGVCRVGKDAEMRYTSTGTAVTNFSCASNRTYEQNNEKVKETTWLRITVWGKLAEACNKYVKKGMLVYVEGILTVDPTTGGPKVWEGKDGSAKANFEVSASVVEFLSPISGDKEERQQEEF